MPSLTFLGAAGTVTGSKHLLDLGDHRVLVDCGLFQGLKELRLRNWAELPVDPRRIDAVVLTHAHLDHCGYLPRLVAQGFRGRVFCTPGTRRSLPLVLPDSGAHPGRGRAAGEQARLLEAPPGAAALHRARRARARSRSCSRSATTGRCRSCPASTSSSSTPGICSVGVRAHARRRDRRFCSAATSAATAGRCCRIRRRSPRRTSCWSSRPTAIGSTSPTTTATRWRRSSARRRSAAAS